MLVRLFRHAHVDRDGVQLSIAALQRLAAEGALVNTPNAGVMVPRLGKAAFDDVLQNRLLLEGEAARLAAELAELRARVTPRVARVAVRLRHAREPLGARVPDRRRRRLLDLLAEQVHEPRVEHHNLGPGDCVDRLANRGELGDSHGINAVRGELADGRLAERQVLHGRGPAEERLEGIDRGGVEPALAELREHTVLAQLVELVDRDERGLVVGGGETEDGERTREETSVVHADRASLDAQRGEGGGGRGDELDLGDGAALANDVDVALHKLAIAPLLWALCAPHWRDLDGAEHRRKLGTV